MDRSGPSTDDYAARRRVWRRLSVEGGSDGPSVPILLLPQSAGNVRQTLLVGILFSAVFIAGGVVLLIKRKAWSTPAGPPR